MSTQRKLVECPSDRTLECFLRGDLSDDLLEDLSEHISACEKCDTRASVVIANLKPIPFYQEPSSDGDDENALAELKHRAKQVAEMGERDTESSSTFETEEHFPTPSHFGRYAVQRVIGSGSFGDVYLGLDPELKRPVAIKVPRRSKLSDESVVEAFLHEAQAAAKLRHPGIVSVYDFGRLDNGQCYVVFEFIKGKSLREELRENPISSTTAVGWLIEISSALEEAHQQGLVHRDLKPSNILLSSGGRPMIADFGLALDDSRHVDAFEVAGTPSYMSPEQIRGETHRIDARSDIWSLGVMFYELLTGHRPFQSPDRRQLRISITHQPPVKIEKYKQNIPDELQRICMRCLAKRQFDRYPSAAALVADLKTWQEKRLQPQRLGDIEITPKGLRSFDYEDADFFVHLLPGPRDRHGIPDQMRFWKKCIEATPQSDGHPINVLHGPTGSGKSSFVKAGLLPHLPQHIHWLRLDATVETTETRLYGKLQRIYGPLDADALPAYLARLRTEVLPERNKRLLIVIDQFEQWLHGTTKRDELIEALRQMDGHFIKCMLVVRSDFWMGVTRLFDDLEAELIENVNSAAIDLFSRQHSLEVFASFGRAFDRLPRHVATPGAHATQFMNMILDDLEVRDGIIPVRLVLYAEILKDQEWDPATFRQLSGGGGPGLAYLESCFDAEHATHKDLAEPARNVLRELLPDESVTLKGSQKSASQLFQRSGFGSFLKFKQLLGALESDLRFISLVEPDDGDDPSKTQEAHYQLTHDFLVPAIRQWVHAAESATLAGRANIRLRERTQLWQRNPSFSRMAAWEWLFVTLYTDRKARSPAAQEMLRLATTQLGRRFALGAMILALCLSLAMSTWHTFRRQSQMDSLLLSDLQHIPAVLDELEKTPRIKRSLAAKFDELLTSDARSKTHRQKLINLAIAVPPSHPRRASVLMDALLEVPPAQISLLASYFSPEMSAQLWRHVADSNESDEIRRYGIALATRAANDQRWDDIAAKLLSAITEVRTSTLPIWLNQLTPIGDPLLAAATDRLPDAKNLGEREAANLAEIVANIGTLDYRKVVECVPLILPQHLPFAVETLQDNRGKAIRALRATAERLGAQDRLQLLVNHVSAADLPPLPESLSTRGIYGGPRGAFVLELPAEQLAETLAAMRVIGYQPNSLRPYERQGRVFVAASWKHGAATTTFRMDLDAAQLKAAHAEHTSRGLSIQDVGHYHVAGTPRYAALWVDAFQDTEGVTFDRPQLNVEQPYTEFISSRTRRRNAGYRVAKFIPVATPTGPTCTTIRELASNDGIHHTDYFDEMVRLFEGRLHTDTRISQGASYPYVGSFHRFISQQKEELTPRARVVIARLWSEIGDHESALKVLAPILASPMAFEARAQRADTLIYQDKIDQAIAELQVLALGKAPLSESAFARIRLASYTGENVDTILADSDQASETDDQTERDYAQMRRLSLAGAYYQQREPAKADACFEAATRLLPENWREKRHKKTIRGVLAYHDFRPLRRSAAFAKTDLAAQRGMLITNAWGDLSEFESAWLKPQPISQHSPKAMRKLESHWHPHNVSVRFDPSQKQLLVTSVWHRPQLPVEAVVKHAEQLATTAIAMAQLGDISKLIECLQGDFGRDCRTYAMLNLASSNTSADTMREAWGAATHELCRQALLIAFSRYSRTTQEFGELARQLPRLCQHPSAGIRSAAVACCRAWHIPCDVTSPASQGLAANWQTNGLGQTLIRIAAPGQVTIGAPFGPQAKFPHWAIQPRFIANDYYLSATETTNRQFQIFLDEMVSSGTRTASKRIFEHTAEMPKTSVFYRDAAKFCQWLSEREGVPESDWCYPGIWNTSDDQPYTLPDDFLERTGYRLPTEAEWEFACRSNSRLPRYFGESDAQMNDFENFWSAKQTANEVASGLPNDWGFFDMLGNVSEWCHDQYDDWHEHIPTGSRVINDRERSIRGASFMSPANAVRAAYRGKHDPNQIRSTLGFRVCRTAR